MPTELQVLVPGLPEPFLFTDSARLGRSAGNDIIIDHNVVSSHHLEMRPKGDGWELVDMGSRNGTFIDGRRISIEPLGASTYVRLGNSGPILHLTIPALVRSQTTNVVPQSAHIDRIFATVAPDNMSPQTQMLRMAVQERREQESMTWRQRMQRYRIALGVLVVVALGAAGFGYVQSQRAAVARQTAAAVFTTIKEIDLDIRKLEATTGPNAAIQEKRARLEKQYDDLVKTLGIYDSKTSPEEKLIYRTIHHLGESEANVPPGFLSDVKAYIEKWKQGDLKSGFKRASEQGLGVIIPPLLIKHHLPHEFFYLPMQESTFNPKAIGPVTYAGIPKGMWQFTPGTGASYGLHIGPLRGERVFDPADDRHNPVKASEAAARYLEDLYTTDAQLSGLLVMASYNMGEGRMRKIIRSLPESPSQRNLWNILATRKKEIPAESYDYMFRVFSAAVIGANPRLFGFDFDPLVKLGDDSTAAK